VKAIKYIVLVVIILVVGGIVFWQGSCKKVEPTPPATDRQDRSGTEADVPGEVNQPKAQQIAAPNAVEKPTQPERGKKAVEAEGSEKVAEAESPTEANEPNEANEPAEPMENINVKDMEVKDVIVKLAEWTGKNIIPCDEVMGQKITIFAPKKVPRRKALALIYSALRLKKFVAEEVGDTIYLKPIKDVKLLSVPTVPPEIPLASIENKEQVVQKFFKLTNYSASQMAEVIVPLVDENGYISADENTGKLLVIDTVENLMRISRIITQFDVPEAEQARIEIFEIHEADPAEIVQILRLLLGAEAGTSKRSRRPEQPQPRFRRENKPKTEGMAKSVVIGPSGSPVVLIPEPRRKWIIAKASPEDIEQISQWIKKLDHRETVSTEYETVQIIYADVREVADRLNEMLQRFPGSELKTSVLVQPMEQARQIVIYGRKDMREVVKKLIEEIDIPTGTFEEKTFDLEYADPEQIKENIDSLYGEEAPSGWAASYHYYRYVYRNRSRGDIVKVIAFPTMRQVTVIASPDNMRKIEKQIEEWDVPLDPNKVKPMILTLHNTDPVKMADLLTTLFTEETRTLGWLEHYFGSSARKKIVGPLYGQLTFEEVPGTKKIIVISKMPEAYKVIRELVSELDKQEPAEIPRVITLKYADPEDLAIRLNAMFNEPGTNAPIYLRERKLSEYSMEEAENGKNSTTNKDQKAPSEYKTWWSGYRRRLDEMPISNVIGRIRFIPDPRSKAIMVLSPPEFIDSVEAMIRDLDIPGRQVRIKAVILEVDHRGLTSLGLQLASNPDAFGSLDENAVSVLTQLSLLEERGALTITGTTDVTALIDFLVKRINAKVLNQQTLWTKDNEEASFFRGQRIAFTQSVSFSQEGGRDVQSVDYPRVGMTLRVRPNITPEKNVDMTINLIISQRTSELIGGQPVRTEMDTQTTLIVEDGETVMLGGMLFQEDSSIERKVPLFGDIPLVGGIFRHTEVVKGNTEILVFVTPYVIGEEPGDVLPETKKQIDEERQRLQETLEELKASVSWGLKG